MLSSRHAPTIHPAKALPLWAVRHEPVPTAILVLGIALLQIQSIGFWSGSAMLGPWLGPPCSVLLELCALWLYWLGGWRRLLGVVATLLLLVGPLHQVASPLLYGERQRAVQESSRTAHLAAAEKDVAELQGTVAARERDLRERGCCSWLVVEASARLDQARARRDQWLASAATRHAGWEETAFIAVQAISLVLFQTVNVLAVTWLASRRRALASDPSLGSALRPAAGVLSVLRTAPEPAAEPPARTGRTGWFNTQFSAAAPPFPKGGAGASEPVRPLVAEPVQDVSSEPNRPPEPAVRSELGSLERVDELRFRRVQNSLILAFGRAGGVNRWCEATRVNKRNVYALLQHFERRQSGGELVSLAKFLEIEAIVHPSAERTA